MMGQKEAIAMGVVSVLLCFMGLSFYTNAVDFLITTGSVKDAMILKGTMGVYLVASSIVALGIAFNAFNGLGKPKST